MQQVMQTLELMQHIGDALLGARLINAMHGDLDQRAKYVALFLIEGFLATGAEQ